jgi:hypothetical protein
VASPWSSNAWTVDAAQSLLTEAKDAIAAGDRARAVRVLDGLRYRPSDEGQQLPPAIAEGLVATARGDRGDEHALRRRLEGAHAARRQILDWIDAFRFEQLLRLQRLTVAGVVRLAGPGHYPLDTIPVALFSLRASRNQCRSA